jgi:hypothetical protein
LHKIHIEFPPHNKISSPIIALMLFDTHMFLHLSLSFSLMGLNYLSGLKSALIYIIQESFFVSSPKVYVNAITPFGREIEKILKFHNFSVYFSPESMYFLVINPCICLTYLLASTVY